MLVTRFAAPLPPPAPVLFPLLDLEGGEGEAAARAIDSLARSLTELVENCHGTCGTEELLEELPFLTSWVDRQQGKQTLAIAELRRLGELARSLDPELVPALLDQARAEGRRVIRLQEELEERLVRTRSTDFGGSGD